MKYIVHRLVIIMSSLITIIIFFLELFFFFYHCLQRKRLGVLFQALGSVGLSVRGVMLMDQEGSSSTIFLQRLYSKSVRLINSHSLYRFPS